MVEAPASSAGGGSERVVEVKISSAPRTRASSLIAFVSTTHVKALPCVPPALSPSRPQRSCSIIHPASCSVVPYVAARLARTCGLTLAMNNFPDPSEVVKPSLMLFSAFFNSCRNNLSLCKGGAESRAWRTSECDCSDIRTASADVTHPEQARQSVKVICAGGGGSAGSLSSVVTSYGF